jgi:hypothetical protein
LFKRKDYMATNLKSLRKDQLMVLLVEAVVEKRTDDITAFSNELLDRIPPEAEPGLVLDVELQELGAADTLELQAPEPPVEHPICPTCKTVRTWVRDHFTCTYCNQQLCPDGGSNPIPGKFVEADGGGVAFQHGVVPDGGDQRRITGGNPPECPKCGGGMMPDESVYRCITCGHAVGNPPTCSDCGTLTTPDGAVYKCLNCGHVMGDH